MKTFIKNIIFSPYLSLAAAFVLLATAGYEIFMGVEEFEVGSQHGIFVFALIQILKVIPDIAEAGDEIETGLKRKKENAKN